MPDWWDNHQPRSKSTIKSESPRRLEERRCGDMTSSSLRGKDDLHSLRSLPRASAGHSSNGLRHSDAHSAGSDPSCARRRCSCSYRRDDNQQDRVSSASPHATPAGRPHGPLLYAMPFSHPRYRGTDRRVAGVSVASVAPRPGAWWGSRRFSSVHQAVTPEPGRGIRRPPWPARVYTLVT